MAGQRQELTQSRPLPLSTATVGRAEDNRAHNDDDYAKSESQWSFTLSRTINKPVDVVVAGLGGLDNFEKLMRVNPVCLEYREVGRDWVGPFAGGGNGLEGVRVREMSGVVFGDDDNDDGGRRKAGYYERVLFEVEDGLVAFCGLVKDVTVQRGCFVWDEESRVGLWEVRVLNAAIDSWARKVIRFVPGDGGDVTRVEEFVEGYSKESIRILEGLTKRFTRNLHKNWMKRYTDILDAE